MGRAAGSAQQQRPRHVLGAAPLAAPLLLLSVCMLPGAAVVAAAKASTAPRFAVYNQVHFHLEVVAGAIHVLQQLTTEPVDVYLPAKVTQKDWYGFMTWTKGMKGVNWLDSSGYDGTTQYDLVWFITPEFRPIGPKMTYEEHIDALGTMIRQMAPKVLMYMVHNGHLAEPEWKLLKSLASTEVPVLTLAPHVTASIAQRGLPVTPDWILPVYPFKEPDPCFLADLKAGRRCLRGFSVQGRIEKSRRNYTEVWEQIGGHKRHHTSHAVSNFKLNILGEQVEEFAVPDEVKELVSVYKNPPYPEFYNVVAHSYALVPMLASPLYYKSKFSSTVLTSLITGVPIIADKALADAYSFLPRDALYYQEDGRSELDVMFAVTRMAPGEAWRARAAVRGLREKLNGRALEMISGWLEAKGVALSPPGSGGGGGGGGPVGGEGADGRGPVDQLDGDEGGGQAGERDQDRRRRLAAAGPPAGHRGRAVSGEGGAKRQRRRLMAWAAAAWRGAARALAGAA